MTYEEMLLVSDVAYYFIPQIERAEDMLRHVWDRYFADAEIKALDEWGAEEVGLVVRSCIDTICGAVLAAANAFLAANGRPAVKMEV